jgi:tetratricopeptide (TPR) repeat protein
MPKQVRNVVLIAVLLALDGLQSTTSGQARPRPSAGPDPLDEVMAGSLFPNVEALGKAAESFGTAREASAQATQEIAAARKAFWAQYPNGPRFQEVQATFARKLYAKDVALLTFARVDRRCSGGVRSAQTEALGTLISAAGANIDGGVAAGASTTFCRWVEATTRMSASTVTSHPFYESYRRDRDWHELHRAGKVAIGSLSDLYTSNDVAWYVMALVWSGMDGDVGQPPRPPSFPDMLERAQQKVDALVKAYGRERVFSMATRVMQAPKSPVEDGRGYSYRLANPRALGCNPQPVPDVVVCFDELVGVYTKTAVVVTDAEQSEWAALSRSSNPRDYVRFISWTYMKDQTNLGPLSTPETRRSQVDEHISRFIAFWGEAAVLDAARRVQAAPKDADGRISYETAKQLGCMGSAGTPVTLMDCLGRLTSSPPRAAPPAATPFNPRQAVDTSKLSPSDAAYAEGVRYLTVGRLLEAQKHFETAIAADPRHAESHYQLGTLFYRNGYQARARIAFETYLKLTPNGPNAMPARNFLSILP